MFAANFNIDFESQATLFFAVAIAALVGWLAWFLWRQLSQGRAQGRELEESFDGIKEQDNPTPKVMHLIGLGAVLFTLWYAFFGYPLGDFSQKEQYQKEVELYQERFDKKWENATDEQLANMGESLFNDKCAACHGLTGDGQNGRAADLIAFGSAEHVVGVIQRGSKGLNKMAGMMPPQWDALGADEAEREQAAKNVAAYVMQLAGKTAEQGDPQAGQEVYAIACATCHGPEGQGNGPGGSMEGFAADLTAYGSPAYIESIIKSGKDGLIGKMPAFEGSAALSQTQYRALSLYVAQRLTD